jgi:hypothetical protein
VKGTGPPEALKMKKYAHAVGFMLALQMALIGEAAVRPDGINRGAPRRPSLMPLKFVACFLNLA